jgi:hypothetical protein
VGGGRRSLIASPSIMNVIYLKGQFIQIEIEKAVTLLDSPCGENIK